MTINSFDHHISELCKKANRKIHASSTVTSYMHISKRPILKNAFFKSKFSFDPLYGYVIVVLAIAK